MSKNKKTLYRAEHKTFGTLHFSALIMAICRREAGRIASHLWADALRFSSYTHIDIQDTTQERTP